MIFPFYFMIFCKMQNAKMKREKSAMRLAQAMAASGPSTNSAPSDAANSALSVDTRSSAKSSGLPRAAKNFAVLRPATASPYTKVVTTILQ